MFTVTIATDNAAFDDDNGRNECARILRELAGRLESGSETTGRLMDCNGNSVGRFAFAEIERDR